MKAVKWAAICLAMQLSGCSQLPTEKTAGTMEMPAQLIDASTVVKNLIVEARYATNNNFVGSKVDGYLVGKCIIHEDVALAMDKVQQTLNKQGYALKVFDCFRPQRAVNHFVRWAQNNADKKTKAQYYPNVPKSELFEQGYIATKSGHSRGATVDLTVINLASGEELDMGSAFDFFDPLSHTINHKITDEQQQNRFILKQAMEAQGFKNYVNEWWHYTYKPEPFPDQYFDGEIK